MPISARRRITMLDALVLVAATAVGLAPIRSLVSTLNSRQLPGLMWLRYAAYLTYGIVILTPILLSWSVADLVICLRRPRPSLRQLARRPGAVAAIVATVWGSLCILRMLALMAEFGTIGVPPVPIYIELTLKSMPNYIGPAVSGAWLVMAISGRWRPEPSWLDRLGRSLGVGWMALVLLDWTRGFL